MALPDVTCLVCGCADAKAIAQRHEYFPGLDHSNSLPAATTTTYQCECGETFSQAVQRESIPLDKWNRPGPAEAT